jgi:5'-3' exonuclease
LPARTAWLLVDAYSLMFRAFYGIPVTMRAPNGQPTNAVRGFLDMLARLVTDRGPRSLVVATDEDWRPDFRVRILPSYKAHRVEEAMPAELEPQVEVILEVLGAIGLEVMGAPGFEAEDVIASLLPKLRGRVEIVTGDRDLFALVRDPDVSVLYTQRGIGNLVVVDEAEIERRYEVPGRAYGEFAVLRGDPSDGLPGLPGVGPKTAAALLRRHGSLDALMRDGRLSPSARAYLEQARQVAVPVATAPLRAPRVGLPTTVAHPRRLAALNRDYGLASVTTRLLRALEIGSARDG